MACVGTESRRCSRNLRSPRQTSHSLLVGVGSTKLRRRAQESGQMHAAGEFGLLSALGAAGARWVGGFGEAWPRRREETPPSRPSGCGFAPLSRSSHPGLRRPRALDAINRAHRRTFPRLAARAPATDDARTNAESHSQIAL